MKKIIFTLIVTLFVTQSLFAEQGVDRKELESLLGDALMIEKDYKGSVEQYRSVLEKEPGNVKVRISLADVLSWQKDYDGAVTEYLTVLEITPDDTDVKAKLAEVYTWKKDLPKAEVIYQELILKNLNDPKYSTSLAEVLVRLDKFKEAEQLLTDVLKGDPGNRKARVLLGDIYAGNREFDQSLASYREALGGSDDRKIQKKIADVLSWIPRYNESLAMYDELLREKEEKEVRLQKARVLGWDRKYREAVEEYRKILAQGPDELIEMELRAKQYYWDNRVKRAIKAYKDLIAKDPENAEARFDLSRLDSYQSMWREAADEYEELLRLYSNHFRAREGLKKVRLVLQHPWITSDYEFFKAASNSRETDITKHMMTNRISIPVNDRTDLGIGYGLTRRRFSDFTDLTEHSARISIDYRRGPDWTAGAFFNMIAYHKAVAPIYEFSEYATKRIFDIGTFTISHERRRLENNSIVIKRRYYRDDFKPRIDLDVTRRIKLGADYPLSYFSDSNLCQEPAGDVLFYLTFEPKALYVKYRYSFRDFKKVKPEYFSPQDFSTHTVSLRWRHFLNKDEIFFGAKDFYYEAGYDLSVDSTGVVGHRISGSLLWDITNRLQVKGEGQFTKTSARIYEDKGAKVSLKYYF